MSKIKNLTEEEFESQFNLIDNHIDPNASWDNKMFETYDDELEFVKQQNPRNVWTIIEGDNDTTFISSGFHLVNRVGYLISLEEWEQPTEVEIEY